MDMYAVKWKPCVDHSKIATQQICNVASIWKLSITVKLAFSTASYNKNTFKLLTKRLRSSVRHKTLEYIRGKPITDATWSPGMSFTHLPLDKMSTILADGIFKSIFMNENYRILIQISLKSVPRSPISNKPALIQVMAWCRTGPKPLPEPMMTQFTDTYMHH